MSDNPGGRRQSKDDKTTGDLRKVIVKDEERKSKPPPMHKDEDKLASKVTQAKRGHHSKMSRPEEGHDETPRPHKLTTPPMPRLSVALPLQKMPRIPKRIPPTESDKSEWRTCLQCDKPFRHRQSLYRHMKTIHGGRRWQCPECQKEYHRRDDFLNHQRSTGHLGMNIYTAGETIQTSPADQRNEQRSDDHWEKARSRSSSQKRKRSPSSPCPKADRQSNQSPPTKRGRSRTRVSPPSAAKGRPNQSPMKLTPPRTKQATTSLEGSPNSTDLLGPAPSYDVTLGATPEHSDENEDDVPGRSALSRDPSASPRDEITTHTIERQVGESLSQTPPAQPKISGKMADELPEKDQEGTSQTDKIQGHPLTYQEEPCKWKAVMQPWQKDESAKVPQVETVEVATEMSPYQEARQSPVVEVNRVNCLVQTSPSLTEGLVDEILAEREAEYWAMQSEQTVHSTTAEAPLSPTPRCNDEEILEHRWPRLRTVEFGMPPPVQRDPRLRYFRCSCRSEMSAKEQTDILQTSPRGESEAPGDARSRAETGPGGILEEVHEGRAVRRAQLLRTPKSTTKDWSTGYHTPSTALLHIYPIEENETQAARVRHRLDEFRRGLVIQDPEVDSPGVDVETLSTAVPSPNKSGQSSPEGDKEYLTESGSDSPSSSRSSWCSSPPDHRTPTDKHSCKKDKPGSQGKNETEIHELAKPTEVTKEITKGYTLDRPKANAEAEKPEKQTEHLTGGKTPEKDAKEDTPDDALWPW